MKKLIRKLVRRNPEKRKKLTFKKIKGNPTFEGVKWVNNLFNQSTFYSPFLIEKHNEEEAVPAVPSQTIPGIGQNPLREETGHDDKERKEEVGAVHEILWKAEEEIEHHEKIEVV